MYNGHYQKGKELEEVLYSDKNIERTILGGLWYVSGVLSYADLTANFNGMRFWNDVLGRKPDVLTEEMPKAFIQCGEDGQWKLNPEQPISFTKYVDEAWNETINCIQFASESGAHKVREAISSLGLKCPISQDKIDQEEIHVVCDLETGINH